MFIQFKSTIVCLCILFLSNYNTNSIIFYSTNDPTYNTTIPIDNSLANLWKMNADWGDSIGIPISPYHFITVQHVDMQSSLIMDGISYNVLSYYDDWNSNIRICKIRGSFPYYVSLYENTDEIGKNVIIIGKGVSKGNDIVVNNELKGWEWSDTNAQKRWGENIVDDVSISLGGDVLKMTFNPLKNLQNLCTLSVRDSGGGTFIKDGTEWKLAGVNYSVDSVYGYNNLDRDKIFYGAVFDEQNLYKFDGFGWYKKEEHTSANSYSIRVSSRLHWIKRVIEWSSPIFPEPVLQSSDIPNGTYQSEINSFVDVYNQTIFLPIPLTSKYFKILSSVKVKIIDISVTKNNLIIYYTRT